MPQPIAIIPSWIPSGRANLICLNIIFLSYENDKTEKLHFDQDQNIKEIEDESKNFDLFTHQNQDKSENHQIDLTDIEQEDSQIDEKVLEIPAFLRRQAN